MKLNLFNTHVHNNGEVLPKTAVPKLKYKMILDSSLSPLHIWAKANRNDD